MRPQTSLIRQTFEDWEDNVSLQYQQATPKKTIRLNHANARPSIWGHQSTASYTLGLGGDITIKMTESVCRSGWVSQQLLSETAGADIELRDREVFQGVWRLCT